MRLHHLSVSAFGPFPQPVEVDFDEVCSAGLFLIHGATGSGKTSLLDAICFALFADVPGARSRRSLGSDHAPAGARPVVVLEFTAAGRRFRIERSPDFMRPKKRGTGETRVPARVSLEEFRGGVWEALSIRHDEVADQLHQVLGMGLAQFAKVVVLPQGDVAAFLRADPEERRALLERLFDISVFTDVEAWLADERRRTAATVEELHAAVERLLAQLDGVLATDDAPDWRELDLPDLPEALAAHAADVQTEVLDLLAEADRSVTELSTTTAEVHRLKTLAETRARGERARADEAAARARAAEMAELAQTVARGRAADALTGHLAGVQSAQTEAAARGAEVDAALAAAGLADADGARPDGFDVTATAALAEQLHGFDTVLTEVNHVIGEHTRAAAEHEQAASDLAFAEVAVATYTEQQDQAAQALDAGRVRVEEVAAQAARLPTAERDHHTAGLAVQIASQVGELRTARAAAAPRLIAVRDDVLTAQAALIELRQRRLDGMAAELAGALTDDAPCPVCGSCDHPAPATATDLVSADEIETAELTLAEAEATLADLSRTDTERETRVSTLVEQLGGDGDTPLDDLVERRSRTGAALREVTAAAADLVVAQDALTGLEAALGVARDELDAAKQQRTAADTRCRAAQTQVEQARTRLATLLTDHADCPCADPTTTDADPDTVVRGHSALTAAVDRLLSAVTAHEDSLTRCRDRESAALEAALERGFDDLDAVRAAAVPTDLLTRHEQTIDQHTETLAIATATLAEDEVVAALAAPEPDVPAAQSAEAAARRAVGIAQAAHSGAESRLAVLRSVHSQVSDLVARLAPAAERAAAIRELADAATGVGGGNLLKMRLSSFVLAARLEKVVALANERLQQLDAGRYVLEHSDARVAGGRRSGLDLRVLDQWTGRSRETASLSGGESFMVSLALALGLADAVREEAGGFDLGTLFVDEGFGTLDEDSLEHVMGVLDGLREGGRAVGVVSHVPDLRTRITHQVVVEKTSSGSDVSIRTVA
ncbi:MAG TPA: SMC family ATPase [Intrasporangiaceae bacterium]|nr:SMC family ATPase [Intrasporangiaceae bacterium]